MSQESGVTSRTYRKIKVMFVMDFIYAITGGTENQVVKIINNLDQARYDLYLVCLHNTPWLSENRCNLKCKVQAFDYNVFNHKDLRNLIALFKTVKHIKTVRPDIVMTFFPTSYIVGVLAARLAGVRRILGTRRDYGLWLDKRSLPLLRFADRFVSRIITNARVVKELTAREESFSSERIDVIYNGIDIKEYIRDPERGREIKEKIGIPPAHFVVGVVAGLRPMKRHHTFLKAARRVLQSNKNTSFVVVGDGSLRGDLEKLRDNLGVSSHVYFVSWQSDIRAFLSAFDIGVNCSANEGLSNAVMEYMAAGLPCIVSNAGGNPELIEDGINGYLFELDDDERLADLILNLLEDNQKRAMFAEVSKKLISERFSTEKMIDEYDRYFSRLLTTNSL